MPKANEQSKIQQSVLIWHPNGQQVALTRQKLPMASVAPASDLIKAVQENWSINALLLHDGGFVFGQQGIPQFIAFRQEWPIFQDNSNAIDQLFEAFLTTMHCVGANRELDTAIPLAFLHRSVIYDQAFRHWKGTVPGVRPQYVNFYLRRAIHELIRLYK